MGRLENPTIEMRIDPEKVTNPQKIEEVYLKVETLAWKERRLIEHKEKRKALEDALSARAWATLPKLLL